MGTKEGKDDKQPKKTEVAKDKGAVKADNIKESPGRRRNRKADRKSKDTAEPLKTEISAPSEKVANDAQVDDKPEEADTVSKKEEVSESKEEVEENKASTPKKKK